MTANDLFNIVPESDTNDLNELTGSYNAIRELDVPTNWFSDETIEKNKLVNIRIIKYKNFDGIRLWELKTVYFDSMPVMIVQKAGRSGRDHRERFITNELKYFQMLDYIRGIMGEEEKPDISDYLIDPDVDMPELTNFYNDPFKSFFDQL